jgi:hypothetical protein
MTGTTLFGFTEGKTLIRVWYIRVSGLFGGTVLLGLLKTKRCQQTLEMMVTPRITVGVLPGIGIGRVGGPRGQLIQTQASRMFFFWEEWNKTRLRGCLFQDRMTALFYTTLPMTL